MESDDRSAIIELILGFRGNKGVGQEEKMVLFASAFDRLRHCVMYDRGKDLRRSWHFFKDGCTGSERSM